MCVWKQLSVCHYLDLRPCLFWTQVNFGLSMHNFLLPILYVWSIAMTWPVCVVNPGLSNFLSQDLCKGGSSVGRYDVSGTLMALKPRQASGGRGPESDLKTELEGRDYLKWWILEWNLHLHFTQPSLRRRSRTWSTTSDQIIHWVLDHSVNSKCSKMQFTPVLHRKESCPQIIE